MLITKIELENIKSYHKVSVAFRRGTTAISGANGAGKTTLVEAVGFALFGYLPYSQEQFVREGEKQGRVLIHLIGSDDRPYEVERRCGSGSRWSIYDVEANSRQEQRADVLDKLHELFGIDRERPLDLLFKDALGVPQGTFTAIFLEAAGKRKQTFDGLLQIEDYKTAADYLLDAQKEYKEQMSEQTMKIRQLEFETGVLEGLRDQLKEARQTDEEQKQQNVDWTGQFELSKAREKILSQQSQQLQTLRHAYEKAKLQEENAQKLLLNAEQQLQTAHTAQEIVTTNQPAYQSYQQAEEALRQLRTAEQERAALLKREANLRNADTGIQERINNLQKRLYDVEEARQRLRSLEPLVEQQIELEKLHEELLRKVERHKRTVSEGKKLGNLLDEHQRKKAGYLLSIAQIEPLIPIAERVGVLSSQLMELTVRLNERKNKIQHLQEKRAELEQRQKDRELFAEKLRKAERSIVVLEEHRAEAEELPDLQKQLEEFTAQQNRLEGNIEGYAHSRAQSAGGQCPLLHESCLNIKQKGMISLESYFENLLTSEQASLGQIQQQQARITKRINDVKRFAEALVKLEKYIEQRDNAAEQLQRANNDLTRLEQDCADLKANLEELQEAAERFPEVEAAYRESTQADVRVRELAGLYKQIQQLQEEIQRSEQSLQELRQEELSLRGSDTQQAQVAEERKRLNDPRGRSLTQQSIIAGEALHLQQLQTEQQRSLETQRQLQELQVQLLVYVSLDADIARYEGQRRQHYAGYQLYLEHLKDARLLPERELRYQSDLQIKEEAERVFGEAERRFREAEMAFDPGEWERVRQTVQTLESNLAKLAHEMKQNQKEINELGQKIVQAEELLLKLEEAQKEYQTLEDLQTMMEQFRKLIKEAAPHVLKKMLGDISAEANRIFGEIMGDRTSSLAWQKDYEITLHRQGVNRTFAQLSGGEQMSAALSVRLALLKKLSTLNIAFFDEPTQNMDELRRMNLAEQIRRVRGFDQLLVISHDDTFEQGLDSLVRLNKVQGETTIQEEDGQVEESWSTLRSPLVASDLV